VALQQLELSKTADQLEDITNQRRRLLSSVTTEGASRCQVKLLKKELER